MFAHAERYILSCPWSFYIRGDGNTIWCESRNWLLIMSISRDLTRFQKFNVNRSELFVGIG